ncbi:tetratricopeptide repeat protein 21B-like [Polyodon spathula]|uniref:tetratricopeptide repeat protein 21B-like n=1 Tax=Polyodon spathula TaxID=7913 RepID=UPI001B7E9396|nr:tetratricopeptide repeat protein 21B-like [Polyodon spathula]
MQRQKGWNQLNWTSVCISGVSRSPSAKWRAGTPEELHVTTDSEDLALLHGDNELAPSVLRNITPEQPYYNQAKEKMADVYLNYRKEKGLFASCYRELVEKLPNCHTYLLLGDAYFNIQEVC